MASDAQSLLDAADRLQQSARRAKPLLMVGLVAIILGFLFLTINLRREAAENLGLARQNAQLAAQKSREADNWKAQADSLRKTLAETQRAVEANDLTRANRLIDIASSEATDLQPARPAPPTRAEVAPLPAAPAGAGDYRLFIQFAGFQRATIADLNAELRRAGWNAQGGSGERLTAAAGLREVRYRTDEDAEVAERLAASVGAALGSRVEPRKMGIIVPGTLELWISQ